MKMKNTHSIWPGIMHTLVYSSSLYLNFTLTFYQLTSAIYTNQRGGSGLCKLKRKAQMQGNHSVDCDTN